MIDVAIIGAGLSGLTAATILKDYSNVTVFEQSRGVSGRMSTRRAEPFHFDHGAQFFTVSTNDFEAFVHPMIEEGVIESWNARFIEFANKAVVARRHWDTHYPHYVGVPGMNAIAKYLSRNIRVNLGVRVIAVQKDHNKWRLIDDQGNNLGSYDWVITTVPAQQASDMLPKSLSFYPQIASVKMKACFSLMLGFGRPLTLDFDAALVRDEDISWISVNSSKPGRDKAFCLLVHSTNQWANEHIDDDRDQVIAHLCRSTSKVIGHDVNEAVHIAIHGWRYANIEKQKGEKHFIDLAQNIAVCGDWCIQGRVEAAFTSGFNMANQILHAIK